MVLMAINIYMTVRRGLRDAGLARAAVAAV
jgi:hypothetical protein